MHKKSATTDPIHVGKTIRLLRRRVHITQAELAKRIGIRAAPMNNIEQGRNLPSAPVAVAIARELGVSLDELFRPPDPPDDQEKSSAESTAPPEDAESRLCFARPGEQSFAEQKRLISIADAWLALEDLCGARKQALIPLEVPVSVTSDGLDDLARRVRTILDIGNSVVFDYLELLENAGLRIVFCPMLPEQHSTSILDRVNRNVLFFINRDLTAERQIFRLAWELGWILIGDVSMDKNYTRDRAARRFAACFLMPGPIVRQTVDQIGVQPGQWSYELILRIKHRFGVSAESFIIRLEELDLIDPLLADQYKTRIREQYQRTNYAEPDASRRVLSPNGRLGDLLLRAQENSPDGEVRAIAHLLDQCQIDCTSALNKTPSSPDQISSFKKEEHLR